MVLPPPQHQHCTDEAQKAEKVLSAVSYIYIYIQKTLVLHRPINSNVRLILQRPLSCKSVHECSKLFFSISSSDKLSIQRPVYTWEKVASLRKLPKTGSCYKQEVTNRQVTFVQIYFKMSLRHLHVITVSLYGSNRFMGNQFNWRSRGVTRSNFLEFVTILLAKFWIDWHLLIFPADVAESSRFVFNQRLQIFPSLNSGNFLCRLWLPNLTLVIKIVIK